MDFGTRSLLRHKKIYRSMDLPFGIARLWSSIEEVSFEYNEALDQVIVRPVRPVSGTKSAQATAQASVTVKTAEPVDHLPSSHFGVQ